MDKTSFASLCGLCHGNTSYQIEQWDRNGDPLCVVICAECGVIHNHPIPSAEDLSRFYAHDYRREYKRTLQPKLRHAARYFSAVSSHIRKHWSRYESASEVLDVGSGSGEFLFLMRELGKNVQGLEPSQDYAEFCRSELGLPVSTGEIGLFSPETQFDHIRLCHVVEHLRDPVGSLRHISGWLRKGGSIYLEVPDFKSYCHVKSPGRMFHYGHIYNFDEDSLDRLLASAGLRVIHRCGATAAFAVPDGSGADLPRVGDATLSAKLEMYARHCKGKLRERRLMTRLSNKAKNRWCEYRVVVSERAYGAIGRRAAVALKKKLAVIC